MIDRAMRLLILLTAVIGWSRTGVLAGPPLPPRALARMRVQRFYHGPGVGCAALSPNGRRIASTANYNDRDSDYVADEDQEEYNRIIVVWDAVHGERLRELRLPRGDISCLAFSPDSRWLAADCGALDEKQEVFIFAVETGAIVRRIVNIKKAICFLQFSVDGKQLHVSEAYGVIRACDAETGKQPRCWQPPPEELDLGNKVTLRARKGVLSPDDKVVAWEMGYSDGPKARPIWHTAGLRVHDAVTNKLLYRKFAKPEEHFGECTFSADGKRMAGYWADHLFVWETATGKKEGTIEQPGMRNFALTPQGRCAVSYFGQSLDNDPPTLNFWDVQSGKQTREIPLDLIRLWHFDNLQPLLSPQAFSADGKTLLLAVSPTLRLFDTATGKERFSANHLSPVTPRFSADGRTLFTSCGMRRCRWDVSGKRPVLLAEERRKTWDCGLAYSVEDRLFLDVHEQQLRLYETATGRLRRTLEGTPASTDTTDFPLFGLFAPDTARVLFGNNRNFMQNVWIYDVKTGKALVQIKPENSRGEPVFSPDGRQVAWADGDGSIHLYDARTGKVVRTLRSTNPLPERESSRPYLCFSLDGARLIVAGHFPGENYVYRQMPTRVFEVSRGRELLRFYAHPEKSNNAAEISHIVCSPDGRLVAIAEKFSGTIRLIELASGKVRVVLAGHRYGIQGLAFAPDGKTLSSGGKDPFVVLWDVTGASTHATTPASLAEGWNDLAGDDGKRAGNAIAFFLGKPEASVAFLREKLQPEETISEKRLVQLLADLDDDAFAQREAASRELIRLGERAEPALRRELTNRPSLEMRRRIEDVLSKLEPNPPSPETLRTLRAIEVLEHLGTPAARRCLEALAKGATDARQTRDANATLQRLSQKR